jgi:hypothetical protein
MARFLHCDQKTAGMFSEEKGVQYDFHYCCALFA